MPTRNKLSPLGVSPSSCCVTVTVRAASDCPIVVVESKDPLKVPSNLPVNCPSRLLAKIVPFPGLYCSPDSENIFEVPLVLSIKVMK